MNALDDTPDLPGARSAARDPLVPEPGPREGSSLEETLDPPDAPPRVRGADDTALSSADGAPSNAPKTEQGGPAVPGDALAGDPLVRDALVGDALVGDADGTAEPPRSGRAGDTELKRVTAPPERAPTVLRSKLFANRKLVAALAVAAALGVSTLAVARSGADASHVESGVTLGGMSLEGRDATSARAAIVELETKLAHRAVPLVLHGREVRLEPSAAGFAVDIDATLADVMATGRASGLVAKAKALFRGRIDVPLRVSLDDALLGDLADDWEKRLIDDHPSLGGIRFEGVTPVAEPPKAGHRIRRGDLSKAIATELSHGGAGPVEVPIEEQRPTLAQADVDAALARAKALTSGPITLTREPTPEDIAEAEAAQEQRKKRVEEDKALAPKKRAHPKKKKGKRDDDAPLAPPKPPPPVAMPTALSLVFSPADLVAMTRITPHDAPSSLEVSLDEAEIQRRIDAISTKLADSARDARFEIDDKDQVTIVPSRPGTRVDPKKVAEAIVAAAATQERRGELPIDHGAEPGLTTEAAEKLGIKGLVTSFTTHHPCCQPRVINIHRIADIMDGALIMPGDTFSVNKYVGPRTGDRGFVVAPSIGDGEMVDTVGGGISQFATTLFNALFDGGYAVRERKAHSFYFNRYPMGIEATLSDPSPDLVFMNDTSAGLLIKTHYDKTSITVKLYGDNGGRKVERHVSSIFEITDPKTEYEADDKLEPDEEKVKEKGSNGWSLWAGRTITMPDGEKREEKRKITYRARPRLVRTHSCNIPKGEPDYTGKACPKKEKEEEKANEASGSTSGDAPNDPAHSP